MVYAVALRVGPVEPEPYENLTDAPLFFLERRVTSQESCGLHVSSGRNEKELENERKEGRHLVGELLRQPYEVPWGRTNHVVGTWDPVLIGRCLCCCWLRPPVGTGTDIVHTGIDL